MLSFLKRVTQLLMLLVFLSAFDVGKVRAQLTINTLIQLGDTPQGPQCLLVLLNDLGQVFVENEQVHTYSEFRE